MANRHRKTALAVLSFHHAHQINGGFLFRNQKSAVHEAGEVLCCPLVDLGSGEGDGVRKFEVGPVHAEQSVRVVLGERTGFDPRNNVVRGPLS